MVDILTEFIIWLFFGSLLIIYAVCNLRRKSKMIEIDAMCIDSIKHGHGFHICYSNVYKFSFNGKEYLVREKEFYSSSNLSNKICKLYINEDNPEDFLSESQVKFIRFLLFGGVFFCIAPLIFNFRAILFYIK